MTATLLNPDLGFNITDKAFHEDVVIDGLTREDRLEIYSNYFRLHKMQGTWRTVDGERKWVVSGRKKKDAGKVLQHRRELAAGLRWVFQPHSFAGAQLLKPITLTPVWSTPPKQVCINFSVLHVPGKGVMLVNDRPGFQDNHPDLWLNLAVAGSSVAIVKDRPQYWGAIAPKVENSSSKTFETFSTAREVLGLVERSSSDEPADPKNWTEDYNTHDIEYSTECIGRVPLAVPLPDTEHETFRESSRRGSTRATKKEIQSEGAKFLGAESAALARNLDQYADRNEAIDKYLEDRREKIESADATDEQIQNVVALRDAAIDAVVEHIQVLREESAARADAELIADGGEFDRLTFKHNCAHVKQARYVLGKLPQAAWEEIQHWDSLIAAECERLGETVHPAEIVRDLKVRGIKKREAGMFSNDYVSRNDNDERTDGVELEHIDEGGIRETENHPLRATWLPRILAVLNPDGAPALPWNVETAAKDSNFNILVAYNAHLFHGARVKELSELLGITPNALTQRFGTIAALLEAGAMNILKVDWGSAVGKTFIIVKLGGIQRLIILGDTNMTRAEAKVAKQAALAKSLKRSRKYLGTKFSGAALKREVAAAKEEITQTYAECLIYERIVVEKFVEKGHEDTFSVMGEQGMQYPTRYEVFYDDDEIEKAAAIENLATANYQSGDGFGC